MTRDEYIAKHFPHADSGVKPCGNQVLVQLRTVPKRSKGGIVLVEETKDFNQGNTRIGILRATGSIAFRHRETGEEWKEGAWAKPGDIVIMPAWGGFRFEVPIEGSEDMAVFCIYNDFDCKIVVTGNPEQFDKIQ